MVLRLDLLPRAAAGVITWTRSGPAVTVTGDGRVKARMPGRVIITASWAGNPDLPSGHAVATITVTGR